jgi:hypothetical protein
MFIVLSSSPASPQNSTSSLERRSSVPRHNMHASNLQVRNSLSYDSAGTRSGLCVTRCAELLANPCARSAQQWSAQGLGCTTHLIGIVSWSEAQQLGNSVVVSSCVDHYPHSYSVSCTETRKLAVQVPIILVYSELDVYEIGQPCKALFIWASSIFHLVLRDAIIVRYAAILLSSRTWLRL